MCKALFAADISACCMLCPVPVASLSPRKYTATTYFLVLDGPSDSITLDDTNTQGISKARNKKQCKDFFSIKCIIHTNSPSLKKNTHTTKYHFSCRKTMPQPRNLSGKIIKFLPSLCFFFMPFCAFI